MASEFYLKSDELINQSNSPFGIRPKSKSTILIIDSDEQICRSLKKSLGSEFYKIYMCHDAMQGEINAASRKPDLILLNIESAQRDSLNLIKTIRSYSRVPIIVISTISDESIKIQALEVGADDYVVKPFGSLEMNARIRANLRRRTVPGDNPNKETVFNIGNVAVDLMNHNTTKNGKEVHLTNIEQRLLRVLIAEHGKVLDQSFLSQQVWGPNQSDQSNNLRIVICNLRAKLEDEPKKPCYIITETGVGYRLAIQYFHP